MTPLQDLDVGLALSGGGFRASLFHLGSLWRLNEMGLLRRFDIITSVSGGSILSGLVARRWNELDWQPRPQGAVATNFRQKIEAPLRDFCGRTIDLTAGLMGILSPFSSMPDELTKAYDKHLYDGYTLQQLPGEEPGKTPRFVFYATNLQSGASVRISRKYLADYKVGRIDAPNFSLAKVVAASSAFPPVFSPVIFTFNDISVWQSMEGTYLFEDSEFKERLYLADGGIYDNLGLEAIWDRCQKVLVSNAGAPLEIEARPATDPVGQLGRVRDIMTEQTRALRERKLVEDFQRQERQGAYWGISTRIAKYSLQDTLTKDNALTQQFDKIRTRLNKFSAEEQGHLINWGYALADAAMRSNGKSALSAPPPAPAWPCPEYALG
ncbi:MAG: patatin-like phospholipase family protein [Desulfobaccales bacterium]